MILQSTACLQEWIDCDAAVEQMMINETPRHRHLAKQDCEKCFGNGGTRGRECECICLEVFSDLVEAYIALEGESIQGAEFRVDFSNRIKQSLSEVAQSVFWAIHAKGRITTPVESAVAVLVARACMDDLYPITVPKRTSTIFAEAPYYTNKDRYQVEE